MVPGSAAISKPGDSGKMERRGGLDTSRRPGNRDCRWRTTPSIHLEAICFSNPGGVSETELLFTNRSAKFASKAGDLAENHFMTIVAGMDRLGEFGNFFLWNGAQDIEFITG